MREDEEKLFMDRLELLVSKEIFKDLVWMRTEVL
jgi:hypothetical protein